MIPLAVPELSGNESKYLEECIKSSFVSSVGPFVSRFEEMVAAAAGSNISVATSSGTTGLHLALVAVGVKRDELVILPSFTFIASANAIAHCGAEPWLLDIDAGTWTLDPELLEYALASETEMLGGKVVHKKSGKRVAAVMPVYTMGLPADMDKINRIADKYGLPVVADAAAALGARYKGNNIGELADLTVFSFNGNKTVTSGGGGGIVGRNPEILALVRHLSTTARVGEHYHHDLVGYNYRMTNIQAAVGCAQMERLGEFVRRKREISRAYETGLENVAGIGFFPKAGWAESACWFSGITIENSLLPEVALLCEKLREKGIGARMFWKPVHLQPPYKDSVRTALSVSENLWSRILTLPCSTGISSDAQETVINALRKLLEIAEMEKS